MIYFLVHIHYHVFYVCRKSMKRKRKVCDDFAVVFPNTKTFQNRYLFLRCNEIFNFYEFSLFDFQDQKYGFGGKKKQARKNTSETASDMSGFKSSIHSKAPKNKNKVLKFSTFFQTKDSALTNLPQKTDELGRGMIEVL